MVVNQLHVSLSDDLLNEECRGAADVCGAPFKRSVPAISNLHSAAPKFGRRYSQEEEEVSPTNIERAVCEGDPVCSSAALTMSCHSGAHISETIFRHSRGLKRQALSVGATSESTNHISHAIQVFSVPGILLGLTLNVCGDPGLRDDFHGVLCSLWPHNARALVCVCSKLRDLLCGELFCVWARIASGMLATGSDDGQLNLISIEAGEAHLLEHESAVVALMWDPVGNRIATGTDDGILRILDPCRNVHATSGAKIIQKVSHRGRPAILEWSPSGRMIATACDTEDRVLRVIDPASGDLILQHECKQHLAALGWTNSGAQLALVCERLTFSLKDRASDSSLSLVQLSTGSIWELDHGSPVVSVAWCPGTSWLATGAENGLLHIIDDEKRCVLQKLSFRGSLRPVVWDPAGLKLAIGCAHDTQRDSSSSTAQLLIVDPDSGQVLLDIEQTHPLTSLIWSDSGTFLACKCRSESDVRILNSVDGTIQHVLRDVGNSIRLAWCPTEDRIAIIDLHDLENHYFHIFDAVSGVNRLVGEPIGPPIPGFTGDFLAWSPCGEFIATVWCPAGEDVREIVFITHARSGRVKVHSQQSDHVHMIAWRP